VAQDVIVSENDCGTGEGIFVEPIIESGEIIEPLRDRIVGRVALEDQKDYEGSVIVGVNQEITEELAAAIQAAGIERVKIRSVLPASEYTVIGRRHSHGSRMPLLFYGD
jgi:DNA-directed RNA polymerase subunit beta'